MGWPWRSNPTSLEALAIRLTAPASEFTQLRAALERQLALTRDRAAAANAESALEAFLDADAISAELLE